MFLIRTVWLITVWGPKSVIYYRVSWKRKLHHYKMETGHKLKPEVPSHFPFSQSCFSPQNFLITQSRKSTVWLIKQTGWGCIPLPRLWITHCLNATFWTQKKKVQLKPLPLAVAHFDSVLNEFVWKHSTVPWLSHINQTLGKVLISVSVKKKKLHGWYFTPGFTGPDSPVAVGLVSPLQIL